MHTSTQRARAHARPCLSAADKDVTECLLGLCGCLSATIHNIKSHTHTHTQQRISAKHGKLAPARRARLEAVGFVFDGTEARRIRDLATPGVPQLEQCAVHTDVPGADLIGQQQLGEEEEDEQQN